MDLWTYLKETDKPVVIYGTGDGAQKVLDVLAVKEIPAPAAFTASDDNVRGQKFAGYTVQKLSDIEEIYGGDFIILVCFGSALPDVIEHVSAIADKHELYVPDVPVAGGGIVFDDMYFENNKKRILKVRDMLADSVSKEVFETWVQYRLTGRFDMLKKMWGSGEDAVALLKIRNDGFENYMDLGAYDGDTIEEFLKFTDKNFGRIIALEPDKNNCIKMKRKFYSYTRGHEKLKPINAAVWNTDTELNFINRGGRGSHIAEDDEDTLSKQPRGKTESVTARSIDSVCEKENFVPTLIKADVEGSEIRALRGGAATLKKHKPRLIIAGYHRTDDMLAIPLLIADLNFKYKIYLRSEPGFPPWITYFYCV